MFWQVVEFEIRYYRKQPLFYVMAAIFFLLPFLITVSPNVSIGLPNNILANSPFAIMSILQVMSFIGLFVCINYAANPVLRDFEFKFAELIYTTQIRKADFIFARFFAAFLFCIAVLLASVAGVLAAELLPLMDPERLGEFRPDAYLFSFLTIVLPNIFVMSCVMFLVATLTRSLMAAYTTALGLITLFSIVFALVDPTQLAILSIIEPFGSTALGEITRYWTPYEQNELIPELSGTLLANRVLWISIAASALAMTYYLFPFSIEGRKQKSVKDKNTRSRLNIEQTGDQSIPVFANNISLLPTFDGLTALRQFWQFSLLEARQVFKDKLFIIMLLLGVFNVLGGLVASTNDVFGTDSYPTTLRVLGVINGAFSLSLIVVIIFYAAELVHRERQTGVANYLNALPFPNWAILFAKLAALVMVISAMQLVVLVTGVLYQLYCGYFNIEIGHYLSGLFLYFPLSIWLYAVLAIFLQVVINQKYLAMFACLMYVIFQIFLPQQGFDQMLYLYAIPVPSFSAFTGFSLGLDAFFWFSLYWGCFALVLLMLSQLFWHRSPDNQWRSRFQMARQRLQGSISVLMTLCLLAFSGLGGFIYYNTNVLNTHYTLLDLQRLQAEYETSYKAHQELPQPEVDSVSVDVAIYPSEREAEIKGTYKLTNYNDVAVTEMHISLLPDITINSINIAGATLVETDQIHGHFVYSLEKPLQPGEKIQLDFDVAWRTPGFVNRAPVTQLLSNGTFFDNTRAFPGIGYNVSVELLDNSIRRRYGLDKAERARKIDDKRGLSQSVLGAHRVDFEATLSTSIDQMAVAPGYLVKEWVEGQRRYFTYRMDSKIWNYISFMSADYEVKRDSWNDIDIEVYYKHEVNVDRMITSVKKSLAYFETNFSPYQYRQFRIFEFPNLSGTFAQSFPNTVPFAETIGFTTDVRNPERVDLPFYVTAHELAHQWWGHQIAGANVQGASLIIESLAQYSALMVMEEEYGKAYMQRFLKTELDRYLDGRGGELLEELPLSLVENQPYIHYRKGSLALYALKDAIGAEKMNAALSQFLKDFAFGAAPYPTTTDLLAEVRRHAGPDVSSLIDDLFERIVIYDLKTESASYVELADGRFEVTLNLLARKFIADGDGKETAVAIDGMFDIAVLGNETSPGQPAEVLYFRRTDISKEQQTITVTVDKRPISAGIDPFNKMIDRLPDDNIKVMEKSVPHHLT